MRIATLLSAGILTLLATTASAGTIHPAVQAQMAAASDQDQLSVIVNMVEQAPVAQLNQELKARRATLRERHAEVVTALQATRGSQQALRSHLEERIRLGGVSGYTSYWISNLLVVQATKAEIETIARRQDVDLIEPNFTANLIKPVEEPAPGSEGEPSRGIGVTPGLRAINAPQVWYELGINGAGRLVANIDTGVDGNHPALRTRWRGYNGAHPWQECWLDLLGYGYTSPRDNYGHGTHVMGTITGLGAGTQDTVGVAWGASWIATNPIDQGVGSGFDNDILAAFQWLTDPDGNPNTTDDVPDVVQNSWGINEQFGSGYTDCDSRWWAVIDNCEAAGVVVTVSAGNEGPGARSLRSPADRATTVYNAFSIGAVDATAYNWPYPIAYFSSRGPTGCNVPSERQIKPEVCAPGVNVYSCVPGTGYSQNYSGTSMAGPHVAGVVALMRQANPNLDVDTIKEVLLATSRDEGNAGEDNTYGWGFIDAYAAVVAVSQGNGELRGYVRNETWQNQPVPGALIRLLETGEEFTTDNNGYYTGTAGNGTYQAVASKAGLLPDTATVIVRLNQITAQDFALRDNAGPQFSNVTQVGTTYDHTNPTTIAAIITDPSTVASASLYYRVNRGNWVHVPMTANGNLYTGQIPGLPSASQVDYYLRAADGPGRVAVNPFGAPMFFHTFYVTDLVYAYAAEDPEDPAWMMGMPGDDATGGVWVREDPVGTSFLGQPVQPENDHTPSPGVKCFVTGNGNVGGVPGDADLDGGCTRLRSPIFDLSQATQAYVNYWRWFAVVGASQDDGFLAEVSSDGGATWRQLELVTTNANTWQRTNADLNQFIELTDQVVFRFSACDTGDENLVEAAVDDFSVETFDTSLSATPPTGMLEPGSVLASSYPNPFQPSAAVTRITFVLSNPAPARLEIYDTSGRIVRVLLEEARLSSGSHTVGWDGRDNAGRELTSGVYFYRLKAGDFDQSRRLTLIR